MFQTLLQTIHEALSLAKSRYAHLEEMETIFANIIPEHGIPNQVYLERQGQQLRDVVASVLYTLKQFSLVLNAWPENCTEKLKKWSYLTTNPPHVLLSSKNEEPFQRVIARHQSIVSQLEKVAAGLEECFPREPSFRVVNQSGELVLSSVRLVFHTEKHATVLKESFLSVSTLFEAIAKLKSEFDEENPLVAPLSFYRERKIFETLRGVNPSSVSGGTRPVEILTLRRQLESAVEDVLVGVQKVVKKQYNGGNEEDVQNGEYDVTHR